MTPRCPNGHFVVSAEKCLVCGHRFGDAGAVVPDAVEEFVDDALAVVEAADVTSPIPLPPVPAPSNLDTLLGRQPSETARPLESKATELADSMSAWKAQVEAQGEAQRARLEAMASRSPQLQAMYDRVETAASGWVREAESVVASWSIPKPPVPPAPDTPQAAGPPPGWGQPPVPPVANQHGHATNHGARPAWGDPRAVGPRSGSGKSKGSPAKRFVIAFCVAAVAWVVLVSILSASDDEETPRSRSASPTTSRPALTSDFDVVSTEGEFVDEISGEVVPLVEVGGYWWATQAPIDVQPRVDSSLNPAAGAEVYTWEDPDGSGFTVIEAQLFPTGGISETFLSGEPFVGATITAFTGLGERPIYPIVENLTTEILPSDARMVSVVADVYTVDYFRTAQVIVISTSGVVRVTVTDTDGQDVQQWLELYRGHTDAT